MQHQQEREVLADGGTHLEELLQCVHCGTVKLVLQQVEEQGGSEIDACDKTISTSSELI